MGEGGEDYYYPEYEGGDGDEYYGYWISKSMEEILRL